MSPVTLDASLQVCYIDSTSGVSKITQIILTLSNRSENDLVLEMFYYPVNYMYVTDFDLYKSEDTRYWKPDSIDFYDMIMTKNNLEEERSVNPNISIPDSIMKKINNLYIPQNEFIENIEISKKVIFEAYQLLTSLRLYIPSRDSVSFKYIIDKNVVMPGKYTVKYEYAPDGGGIGRKFQKILNNYDIPYSVPDTKVYEQELESNEVTFEIVPDSTNSSSIN